MRLKLRIALLHLCQKVKLRGQKYKTSILAQNRTFDFLNKCLRGSKVVSFALNALFVILKPTSNLEVSSHSLVVQSRTMLSKLYNYTPCRGSPPSGGEL